MSGLAKTPIMSQVMMQPEEHENTEEHIYEHSIILKENAGPDN
jgi:hypothetical protein